MLIKEESGMRFQFNEKYYYSIEEDSFYNKITSKHQAKICDFITIKNNELLLIEAKSSAPKNKEELTVYSNEIYKKFYDSLIIYIGVINDRKNTLSTTIGREMKDYKHIKKGIKLILIINNIPKNAIIEIKNVFEKVFRKLKYLFSIESIIVINDQQAKSKGFIL